MKNYLSSLTMVFFFLLIQLLIFSCKSFFPDYDESITPAKWGFEYREISFKTDDQVRIESWLIEQNPHNPWIIFVTGLAEPRYSRNTRLLLTSLHKYRYNFLILFPRGYNGSGGVVSGGLLGKKDILAGIKYIRANKYKGKIGVIGFSQGAVASVGAASASDQIEALALFAPYASFEDEIGYAIDFYFGKKKMNRLVRFARNHPGLVCWIYERLYRINTSRENPISAIKSIRAPIVLGHGKKDPLIPYHNGQLLAKSSSQVEFITLSGGHTLFYQNKKERAYFISRVIRVMNSHLWLKK